MPEIYNILQFAIQKHISDTNKLFPALYVFTHRSMYESLSN